MTAQAHAVEAVALAAERRWAWVVGVIIAAVGESWCFAIDAVSYIAVIMSLLAMRLSHEPPARTGDSMLTELREGYRYVSGFPPVRTALILLAIVSAMGMPYTVLMPVIATNVLHGGAHTLGFLMTASGLGAVAGFLGSGNLH